MAVKYDPILDALREDDSGISSDTAANLGTGVGIFANKTSGVFNFNSLANSTTITVSTASGGNITLHLSSVPPALIPDPLSVNNLNVYSTATITLIDAIDITTNTLFTNYVDFDLLQTTAPIEGRAIWNDDSKTLELGLKGGFPLEVGMQMVELCVNKTGSTISKGKVVYINGGQGNRPTITLADNSSDATSARTFGIVAEDIPNNNSGYVVSAGLVTGLDTNAYTAGTQLYLSTNGDMTSTKPVAPAHMVYVARVITQNSTVGIVYVGVMNGLELEELHDVLITSVANKDIISWDSTTSLWKNKSIATLKTDLDLSGTNSGDITVTDSSTIDFTLTGQALTGSVIQSGITHNNLGSLQGGTAGEYNHLTNAELTKLQNITGTNTGDVTVTDSSTIDFTLTGQALTGSVIQSGITHNNLSGLTTGDPHTQYLLLAGRTGGQTITNTITMLDTTTFKKGTVSDPAFVFAKSTVSEWTVGWYVDVPFPIAAPNARTLNWSINGTNGGRFADSGLQMASGSGATGPSYTFLAETQSGMYFDTSRLRPSFTNYGTRSGAFAIGQFIAEDGTEVTPGIGFFSETQTGFFLSNSANPQIGFTAEGSEIGRFGWAATRNVPRFSINSTSLGLAMLAANQSNNAAAIPALYLNQVDLDQAFIDLRTTVSAGNPINTTTLGTYYGKFRVEVNGTAKWVGLYN